MRQRPTDWRLEPLNNDPSWRILSNGWRGYNPAVHTVPFLLVIFYLDKERIDTAEQLA